MQDKDSEFGYQMNEEKGNVMETIIAGIVSFNPDLKRLEDNIRSIQNQVEQVLLVENGSKNQDEVLSFVRENFPQVLLLTNSQNQGIAVALNQLLAKCREMGGKWLLTLDQDSVSPDNLISTYQKYLQMEQVAMLCPRIIDRNSGMAVEHKDDGANVPFVEVDRCITSATLMNTQAADEIGNFDEKMFIDYVDFEYCIRLRKSGYKIIKVNETELLHELGNTVTRRFLGKKIQVLNHSPFRKYYYIRNIIYTYRKHKDVLPRFYYVKPIVGIYIKTMLFERDKMEKLKKMQQGFRDGKKMALS